MVRMPPRVVDALACPVCAAALAVTDAALRCPNRHAFDFARQGYVNLLTGRVPTGSADTAEMVAARAEFLTAGHYAPLAALLAERAGTHAVGDGLVIDAGAGVGYYLGAVLDALPAADGLAMDLSALALRRAARAHPRLGAVVSDVWRPWPVRPGVASVLLNVFAPRNGAEFRRVLRPDGMLLVVTPGPDHLGELGGRAGLLAVDPDKERRMAVTLSGFTLIDREPHRVPLRLSPVDVWRLVHMGPAGHHRSDPPPDPGGEPTPVTASFVLSAYRPT
jgi:23S rRNA (guanine745-N1)-methyltransferase